jgi:aryl-alcohol dehydrogenase-like predicted oxidoreductase
MLAQRTYGDTGHKLSVVGFGGIVVMNATPEESRERVAWAVDQGVNYFDVAPSYGNAEERLGPALKPYREKVFLACKTGRRDANGAREELEASLKRMQTDHFDLYQLHAMTTPDDVAQVFGPNGALETYQKAREEGKVKYLGFSAHSETAALQAMEKFKFDSILFPINFAAWNESDFGPKVMEAAKKRGVARLALKAMAHGKWPEGAPHRYAKTWYEPVDDNRKANLALRWTLSQDITAALPPGEWPLFQLAVKIAQDFRPITEEETIELMEYVPKAGTIFPLQPDRFLVGARDMPCPY